LQLVKHFPAFYGTPRFVTALTSAATCSCPEPGVNKEREGRNKREYMEK